MGAHRRLVLPAWTGFLLVAVGFVLFAVSYFLLPLYVGTLDVGSPQKYAPTTWAFSLNVLSNLPGLPIAGPCILVACYLPLLAAVTVVVCSGGYLAHPQRMVALWSYRVWLAGGGVLVLFLMFSLLGDRPEIGFLGLLVGYGLLWAGNRVFLTAQP